jgi:hypothetical protein
VCDGCSNSRVGLRQRGVPSARGRPSPPGRTPAQIRPGQPNFGPGTPQTQGANRQLQFRPNPGMMAMNPAAAASPNQRGPYVGPPPGPPLPRSIPARDRSVFRQLVDGMLGEGPGSNYALICSQCKSHNGLAMKEEFEYLGEPFQTDICNSSL